MTTVRECRCNAHNKHMCDIRATRGLPCLLTMPTVASQPGHRKNLWGTIISARGRDLIAPTKAARS